MKAECSNVFIANELGRRVSTIERELSSNGGLRGYRSDQAHALAYNRHIIKPKALKMTVEMIKRIEHDLGQQWSPEQIQGRLLEQNFDAVCPKTIYNFIAQDKVNGGALHKNIRHKKYKRRTGSADIRGQICNRTSIDERPDIADENYCDWQGTQGRFSHAI